VKTFDELFAELSGKVAAATTSTPTCEPPTTPRSTPVLRVAVPNKGALSEPAAAMLDESGYRQRRSTKDLAVYDPDSDTEFFYLRPRDIAVYVAAGTLDVGITGRDMLLETAPAET
jgi:hypothetical protein